MPEGLEGVVRPWIETFQSRTRRDLQARWLAPGPAGALQPAIENPWGASQRPDWFARGLLTWPRGGQWLRLSLQLECPPDWRQLSRLPPPQGHQLGHQPLQPLRARLVLGWWADAVVLAVDGQAVHRGDLFDTACRWVLPERWWQGEPLALSLALRSPCHDDGALIESRLELEPGDRSDPGGLLAGTALELLALRAARGQDPAAAGSLQAALAGADPRAPGAAERLGAALQAQQRPAQGGFQLLGHAHLDLAWLWPVADTWRAAERTFESVLGLMERHPQLHFGHSTPALYAWIAQHRPALFARIRQAMAAGRWEPINGPWVESDCVLIATASLLRQFQLGQAYSRATFPEWQHQLCWLPDSFGFGGGLPAVAQATGVRWFCTHKLAWNATNPFPHRLFRWRSRCGSEVLALATAPIGTGGDPVAMERYRLDWQAATGLDQALWLPGVGDHGGGPTVEMLEQLELWQDQPLALPQRHGTLRQYLAELEPLAPGLPVWREELYLELHRGCATSRPDQKRHNRSLERLLREADIARALRASQAGSQGSEPAPDWRPLLFQQFHDILPGTSIPDVFEQAEPQWRAARRAASGGRDRALWAWLGAAPGSWKPTPGPGQGPEPWALVQLQPLAAAALTRRLPPGRWCLAGRPLVGQPAPGGGQWLQVPLPAGITNVVLQRHLPARGERTPAQAGSARLGVLGEGADAAAGATPAGAFSPASPLPVQYPVTLVPEPEGAAAERVAADLVAVDLVAVDLVVLDLAPADQMAEELAPGAAAAGSRWRLSNGLVTALLGPAGVEQLWGVDGLAQLAAPLQWCRWGDRGEFWDAWDLAANYRSRPLPLSWEGPPQLAETGPLCARLVWRGLCGRSRLRLDVVLRAASPFLELTLAVDWRQVHELLRLELPLAQPALRLAADTSGGVIERPAAAQTARERSRWEVPVISWLAAEAAGSGLAVLLDGPQGASGTPERLGVSLLRAPTWPDPGADNGPQRLRLALMPCQGGWRQAGVSEQAVRFREPPWLRPWPQGSGPERLAGAGSEGQLQPAPPLGLGDPHLRLIGLRCWPTGSSQPACGAAAAVEPGQLALTVQNLSPMRQQLRLGPGWQLLGPIDGLDQPLDQVLAQPTGEADPRPNARGSGPWDPQGDGGAVLRPWQLASWRIRRLP
ncbi:MAG: alpha-mannosidase [Cyanobacteria bacterium]|nr:alpha-mannosidase [Cyanobacteriota bacterium]